MVAYDLTSNDDTVSMTVYLKNEDGTFDCEDVGLSESANDMDNASGATCNFDLTGATADSGYTIRVTVDPEGAAGTNKEYVFTVRLSESVVVGGSNPTLLPASSTLVPSDVVSFNGTVASLFTNETTVQYQWYLCTAAVTASRTNGYIPRDKGCVAKSNAIQPTYTVVASDAGKYLVGALIGQPGSVLMYTASKIIAGTPGVSNAATPPAPTEAGLVGDAGPGARPLDREAGDVVRHVLDRRVEAARVEEDPAVRRIRRRPEELLLAPPRDRAVVDEVPVVVAPRRVGDLTDRHARRVARDDAVDEGEGVAARHEIGRAHV